MKADHVKVWPLIVLLPLAAVACFSRPLLPRLPVDELARIGYPPGSPQAVHFQCVQTGAVFELRCDEATAEVAKLLAPSNWFSTLEATSEDASLIITVYAPVRRPYWTKPGHNPAALLLSPVIPFWWSEPHGHRLTARLTASGKEVQIDTTWAGTSVMWGGAPLLNLNPNRSLSPRPERELQHIQFQLLPLFPGSS